jgi:IS5 family transposase
VVDATLYTVPVMTMAFATGDVSGQEGQTAALRHEAHIGMVANAGFVHTVTTTVANAHDVTQAQALLYGQEEVFAGSSYSGVEKCQEIQDKHAVVDWEIAMMTGKCKALDKTKASHDLRHQIKKFKTKIRDKLGHPFREIKCQFGHRKTRYRGLAKNSR